MRVQSHPTCFDLNTNIIFLLNVGKNPIHVESEPTTKLKLMCNFRSDCTVATHLIVCVATVQALRLCTGRTAHRGSRGIAVLYRH